MILQQPTKNNKLDVFLKISDKVDKVAKSSFFFPVFLTLPLSLLNKCFRINHFQGTTNALPQILECRHIHTQPKTILQKSLKILPSDFPRFCKSLSQKKKVGIDIGILSSRTFPGLPFHLRRRRLSGRKFPWVIGGVGKTRKKILVLSWFWKVKSEQKTKKNTFWVKHLFWLHLLGASAFGFDS